jgi:hypothetical protein
MDRGTGTPDDQQAKMPVDNNIPASLPAVSTETKRAVINPSLFY